MTQSSLQTHCPKCDTRFRVTDAQLSVAGGKVRCGNCMSVFNAIEHKIGESGTPAQKEQAAQPEDDVLFADNPAEDSVESSYTGTRLTFTDDELSDSFRSFNEQGKTTGFAVDFDEESGEPVDESWAEAMLSDDKDLKKTPEPEPVKSEKPQAPVKDDYEGFFIDEPEPSALGNDRPSAFGNKKPPEPVREEPSASDDEQSPGFADDEPQDRPGPSEPESPYQNFRREPVAVSGGGGGGLRRFLWFLVILALLGGLVSQVVWFQFDRLSSIPQLRPFYVQGCEMFGCELKPLVDVQSIQSRKLVVRTNPENRSQLIVDAVIINRAAFEQPFPAIALTFSNLNSDVVAQSVFTPEEYLAGDGKDLEAMPPDTPVRILINIRDPGKDAVNYNIAFRAQTP
jgi:predicted Zn finger-like uncharacterized protein